MVPLRILQKEGFLPYLGSWSDRHAPFSLSKEKLDRLDWVVLGAVVGLVDAEEEEVDEFDSSISMV